MADPAPWVTYVGKQARRVSEQVYLEMSNAHREKYVYEPRPDTVLADDAV